VVAAGQLPAAAQVSLDDALARLGQRRSGAGVLDTTSLRPAHSGFAECNACAGQPPCAPSAGPSLLQAFSSTTPTPSLPTLQRHAPPGSGHLCPGIPRA
jgi:hypothetical protein